ncbi:sulfite exporter TauE/SafE family protein [Streptosporangiaceae bacterium NEAU-GS5]|nr:sulfite exporter TauE/SafE family protein [Streptosporangiaceae bacterium NEAU-GS5]
MLGLFGAGLAAGVVSTVVSLASIVSYPALLAVGIAPLAANVTNTVSLVFTGVGAAIGSRPELAGQRHHVVRLSGISLVGGATGATLLLLTPAGAFERIAPLLIAGASLLLIRRPRPRPHGRLLYAALFVVATYVGYFGAAGGVLMLAVLSAMFDKTPARINAIKNVLSGFANAVAAIGFALFGPVVWWAVAPLAAGFLIGGWLGPKIARRLPGQSLRYLAAACGLAVAGKLAIATYA